MGTLAEPITKERMEGGRAPPHRFTVDAYHKMAETGILGEDDRVELLDGEIVDMPPISAEHAGTVNLTLAAFARRVVHGRHLLSVQNPLRLDPWNEPVPDLLVLRWRQDAYTKALPGPADVLLLVEVMRSSHDYDRRIKLPLYARFGIPEVWLVDLPAERVEVHREPSAEGYRSVHTVGRGEKVRALLVDALELDAADLLPPPGSAAAEDALRA
ncbi:MAG: Uma2 family endonuclease [Geminicoccaceae bacterium]|nr:Uma2 family endonuclease [Geminicoccaceae bacterium]